MTTQVITDWENEIQRRRVIFLNYLLLTIVLIGVVALVSLYITMPANTGVSERLKAIWPFFGGWLGVLIVWTWRGLGYRYRAMVVILLAYVISFVVFARSGLAGSGRVWLLLLSALTFIFLGPRAGIGGGVISILTYAFFTIALNQKWFVPNVAEDLTSLTPLLVEGETFLLVATILTLILQSLHQSWLKALLDASTANQQLHTRMQELENTNEQLRRQTSQLYQLQTTAEIAQVDFSTLDLERLLVEIVNRIREEFAPVGVYYVGMFLLDETRRFAVLRAAAGEVRPATASTRGGELVEWAAQSPLEIGHRLELDETSTVGWSIIHRKSCPASSMGGEEDTKPHAPLVPRTHTEIALPLRSRGSVIGALNLQSTQKTEFSEIDIAVLRTMADRVALAIDNAHLFRQTQTVLEEAQALQRRYMTQAWQGFLTAQPMIQIDYAQPGIESGADHGGRAGALLRRVRREVTAQGQTVVTTPQQVEDLGTTMVVPLKLREQVIGTMTLHEMDQQRQWTDEDVALAETIAEQVALTIENLRLMDGTQRRAARERLVNELSEQMQRAPDMKTLMRITAEGLNKALGGSRAFVRMGTAAELAGGEGSGHTSEKERQREI